MQKAKKLFASLLAGVMMASAPAAITVLSDAPAFAGDKKETLQDTVKKLSSPKKRGVKKKGKSTKKTITKIKNVIKERKDKKDKKKSYKPSPSKSYKSSGNRR